MGRSISAYWSCCQAASPPWQISSTLTNSVTCTSGFPCRATMNRKAGSVTPSMGERPMIGCGMSCQKLTGAIVAQRPTKIEGTSPRLVPSYCWPILFFTLLADQNVAAPKCAPFCRAAVHRNGERVRRARLAVIRHIDGKGARRTVHGAGAIEGRCIRDDRERGIGVALHLRAGRMVEIL